MYSKYCDGTDTHKMVIATHTGPEKHCIQDKSTSVPVRTGATWKPVGSILMPLTTSADYRICHLLYF